MPADLDASRIACVRQTVSVGRLVSMRPYSEIRTLRLPKPSGSGATRLIVSKASFVAADALAASVPCKVESQDEYVTMSGATWGTTVLITRDFFCPRAKSSTKLHSTAWNTPMPVG